MQPLPRLMQTIHTVTNTQTIFATLSLHYFNCSTVDLGNLVVFPSSNEKKKIRIVQIILCGFFFLTLVYVTCFFIAVFFYCNQLRVNE